MIWSTSHTRVVAAHRGCSGCVIVVTICTVPSSAGSVIAAKSAVRLRPYRLHKHTRPPCGKSQPHAPSMGGRSIQPHAGHPSDVPLLGFAALAVGLPRPLTPASVWQRAPAPRARSGGATSTADSRNENHGARECPVRCYARSPGSPPAGASGRWPSRIVCTHAQTPEAILADRPSRPRTCRRGTRRRSGAGPRARHVLSREPRLDTSAPSASIASMGICDLPTRRHA